jgi:hypothetical protein
MSARFTGRIVSRAGWSLTVAVSPFTGCSGHALVGSRSEVAASHGDASRCRRRHRANDARRPPAGGRSRSPGRWCPRPGASVSPRVGEPAPARRRDLACCRAETARPRPGGRGRSASRGDRAATAVRTRQAHGRIGPVRAVARQRVIGRGETAGRNRRSGHVSPGCRQRLQPVRRQARRPPRRQRPTSAAKSASVTSTS